MLTSLRGWYTKALNVTDIILNKMLILPENWNQTALLVFIDMASPTCFLRGIYIGNRYFQIYSSISSPFMWFNSRWLSCLLLIASPFRNKKKLSPCKTPAYWRAFPLGTLTTAATSGDGDTSPQLMAGSPGFVGCSSTQRRHCSATLSHLLFPYLYFMCKADTSIKGLSYLKVLEKWLLNFKRGLNTNLFILFLNFSANADKKSDSSVPL